MSISQQASGTWTGTSFTATLPAASSASNRVVVIVAANTTVTTPSGFTLRTSQVNFMGHYLYDRAGGSASYAFSTAAGQGTWWIAEIPGGVYDTSSSQNQSTGNTSYNTTSLVPASGTKMLIASIGSVISSATVRTVSNWNPSTFVEQADVCYVGADYPMQGVAMYDAVAANGSTSYSVATDFSAGSTGRTAIIASYSYSAGGSTVTGAAALNAPGVLASAPFLDQQAAASLVAPGVLASNGAVVKLAGAALLAPGSLAANGDVQKAGAATLAAPGVLAATAQGTTFGAAALAAPGVISTSATLVKVGAAALLAPGVLVASGGSIVSGAAALNAPGALSADSLLTRLGAASLAAPGSLAAAALLTRLGAASLAAPGRLDASAGGGVSAAAALNAPGALSSQALLTAIAAAALNAPGVLVASGGSIVSGAASLVAPGVLTASAEKIKLAAAALNAPGVLVSGGLVTRQAAATLFAPGVLVAQPAASTVSGAALLRAPGILTAYAIVAPPGLDIDGPFLVVLHPNSWRARHENPWDAIVSPNSWRVRVDDSKEYDSQSADWIWLTVTNKWESSQLPSLSYTVAFNPLGDDTGARTYYPAAWDSQRAQVRIMIGPGTAVGQLAIGDWTARVLIGGLVSPRAPIVVSDPVRIR